MSVYLVNGADPTGFGTTQGLAMGGTGQAIAAAPGKTTAPACPADDIPLESDAVLVARAKRNPAEFASLYLRYVDPIYRYSYRRLGRAELAADATSQIFAKALGGLSGCAEASFRSWLFSIAHNVLIDQLRAFKPEEALEVAAALHDPAPTPEEAALAGETRAEMRRVLHQLSPDQRQVVELRLAGLRSSEIGEVLGRSRGAIDAIQSRAVARLRELLAPPASGGEARHAAS